MGGRDGRARTTQLVAGVALHPNEAPLLAGGRRRSTRPSPRSTRWPPTRGVRAVGETGLDYFRTGADGRAGQEASFRAHIEMAKRHGKALVIHDRDAHDDVLARARGRGRPGPRRLPLLLRRRGDGRALRRTRAGACPSPAPVTFKNAAGLRAALAVAPLDRLLVETDAPYLTPMPYRGRPNASYLVPHTVRAMAEVKGVDEDTLASAIAASTEAAFGTW